MEHDKQRDKVCRDQNKRQLRHRSRRDRPGESGDKTGTKYPGANGNHEIQYSKKVPGKEKTACPKVGLADEGKHGPGRGQSYKDVPQPSRPGEQAGQNVVGIEGQKAQSAGPPGLDGSQDPEVSSENQLPERL